MFFRNSLTLNHTSEIVGTFLAHVNDITSRWASSITTVLFNIAFVGGPPLLPPIPPNATGASPDFLQAMYVYWWVPVVPPHSP